MLDDEVQARQRRRANDTGSGNGYPQTEGCKFGHYDQLLRELRMEDNSSFFYYMKMEPLMFDEILNRVSPRMQKSDTPSGKHLNQA